jgi:transcriptional regulator with XRE-family HTH domain
MVMKDSPQRQDDLIASRLDHLFRTVHPKDRGPYTPAEVAAAVNEAAGENVISAVYVWQLRTGRRANPTYRHLIALAQFFAVPPTYFFPDTSPEVVPPEVLLALRDDRVRDIVLRAAGLSDRSLKAISDLIDSARAL